MIKKDDELDQLEENIRKLKNKYDQFFTGFLKVPPMTERRTLEIFIFEFSKQKIRDNGRRFRFSTLVSKYNQHREMWARRMREREEGPLEFKRRQAAMSGAPAPPPPPSASRADSAASVTSAKDDPYVKVTPSTNGEAVRKLYEDIEKEHLKMGKLPPVTIEQLSAMVQKQTDAVRARYHVDSVAFRVETVDGKVKLKAKPLQD